MRIAFALFALCWLIAEAKHHRHRSPVIDLHGADSLTATIREDETILSTVPEISLVPDSGPVCKYTLTSADGDVPFDIEVVDKFAGSAVVRLKAGVTLDCKKREYLLQMQAVRCDDESNTSESVALRVSVKDTNNHAPEFDSPWYTFTVQEGHIVNEIAKLKATDKDCGDPYGEICEYRIENALKDFPFTINNQGVLKNTAPLNYTQAKSFILTVVAIDCGMRQSRTVLVTVNVEQTCFAGVKNTLDRVDFYSAPVKVLPDAKVDICDKDYNCEVSTTEAVLKLHAGHVTPGCSREAFYSNETIKSCKLNADAVQLLDSQVDTEKPGYTFDGESNAIAVPSSTFNGVVKDVFALSFSMRHEKGTREQQSNKQNVLCESDEKSMNRHHFNVYIRHCKLELVLRREHDATAEFRAAEWRWAVPQVCDGMWHDYTLLLNGVDDVHLMIDGDLLKPDEKNPEILDDWPLHKAPQENTKLVIGACWHGRHQKMVQHFRGELQSIFLLNGAVETTEAVSCAHKCPEQLSYELYGLSEDKDIFFSPDRSTLTLKSSKTGLLSRMMQNVEYINTMSNPKPGHRSIITKVKTTCKSGKVMELPPTKTYVFVSKPPTKTVSISGQALVTVDQHKAKLGTDMIPGLKIVVSETASEEQVTEVTSKSELDYCKIHLKPSRDMDVEYFSSPASLIATLKIDFEHDKDGVLLKGRETVEGYLSVLSKIHYFNSRPEAYNKRIYSVQCAMDKGSVLSNEFIVTMTINSPPTPPSVVLQAAEASVDLSSSSEESLDSLDMLERHFEPAFDQMGSSRIQNILELDLPRPKALMSHHGYEVGQGAVAGGAVAVVVVVCVGFLLVLLVVGVLKMRDTPAPRRRKPKRQDDGLHWDDSGMNITVNPLDDVEKNDVEMEEEEYSEDDASSDGESECSYREEDVSDEEEGPEVLPHLEGPRSGLEWDDEAALTANARSYRV